MQPSSARPALHDYAFGLLCALLGAYAVTTVFVSRLVPFDALAVALNDTRPNGWPGLTFLGRMVWVFVAAASVTLHAMRGPRGDGGPEALGPMARALVVNVPLVASVVVVLSQQDTLRRGPVLGLCVGACLWIAHRLGGADGEVPQEPAGSPDRRAFLRRHAPVLLVIATHLVAFSWITIRRDRALWSATVDLGIFMEALWNTLHGNGLMFSPTVGYSFLGEHFSPILFLLLPFYALWSSAACLLILQVASISVSAWPLYRLALANGLPRFSATVIAGAMIVAPTMQGSMIYDFHMDLLGVPAFAWALWAAHERRPLALGLSVACMLATKEDTFVHASGIALALYLSGEGVPRRWRLPLLVAGLSILYCGLAIKFFLPHFGPPEGVPVYMGGEREGYKFLRNFRHFATEQPAILHPLRYLLWMFSDGRLTAFFVLTAPVLLLGAFSGTRLPVLAPLAILLLSDNPEITVMSYHYGAMQHPGVYAAAIYGMAWWLRRAPASRRLAQGRAMGAAVAGSMLVLLLMHPRSLLAEANEQDPRRVTDHTRTFDRIAALVPPAAPIAASSFGGTHFSNRPYVSIVGYRPDIPFRAGARLDPTQRHLRPVSHVMVDLQRPAWPTTVDGRDGIVYSLLRSGAWDVLGCEDGIVLLAQSTTPDRTRIRTCARETFLRRAYEVEGTEQTEFTNAVQRDPEASDGYARVVRPTDPRGPGFLVFGPFVQLPNARWRVTFRLRAEPTAFGDAVGTVDVFAGGRVLAERRLVAEDFPDPAWRDVVLEFTTEGQGGLEFRVRTDKQWVLGADRISLRTLDDEDAMLERLGL